MTGYALDAEAVLRCGSDVGNHVSTVQDISSAVAGATVPPKSWGLIGMATTYSMYEDMLTSLNDHLSKMQAGLTNAGDSITRSARTYLELEEAIAGVLGKLLPGSDAGDVGPAGEVGERTVAPSARPDAGNTVEVPEPLPGSGNADSGSTTTSSSGDPGYDIRDHGFVPRDQAEQMGHDTREGQSRPGQAGDDMRDHGVVPRSTADQMSRDVAERRASDHPGTQPSSSQQPPRPGHTRMTGSLDDPPPSGQGRPQQQSRPAPHPQQHEAPPQQHPHQAPAPHRPGRRR
jgi:hypothetical protein